MRVIPGLPSIDPHHFAVSRVISPEIKASILLRQCQTLLRDVTALAVFSDLVSRVPPIIDVSPDEEKTTSLTKLRACSVLQFSSAPNEDEETVSNQ